MRKRFFTSTILLPAILSAFFSAPSIAQAPTISYSVFLTGLDAPIDIVNAGDGSGRLFIAQQGGIVRMWDGTTLSDFLNVGPAGENLITTGGSEEGLLSIVFHPDYDGATNRFFFIYYTDLSGNIALRRYETQVGNPDLADVSSDVLLLTIPHPGNSNHNGGKLNFGPDGYLYFATGDGGGANDAPQNAQNKMSLLGKMLRIDVNSAIAPFYTVPSDNPYVDSAGFDNRIYNLGLRNPFRWSFDRLTGNMWIGDVGQGAREEINYRPAGNTGRNNFGWRCFEGLIPNPNIPSCDPDTLYDLVFPIYDYPNPSGAAAVTGGYVYRGPDYPNFYGYYIAADVYSGNVYVISPDGPGWEVTVQPGLQNFIVAFGEDEDGTLYAASLATGEIYLVEATGGTPLPVKLVNFSAKQFNGYNILSWRTSFEEQVARFRVEFSTDAIDFTVVGSVNANGTSTGSDYTFQHYVNDAPAIFYRLAAEDLDGSITYSNVLKLISSNKNIVTIYPNLINERSFQLSCSQPAENIRLFNYSGSLVFEQSLGNLTGATTIRLPELSPGMYVAEIAFKNEVVRKKVILK